jgi:hypothetical protein
MRACTNSPSSWGLHLCMMQIRTKVTVSATGAPDGFTIKAQKGELSNSPSMRASWNQMPGTLSSCTSLRRQRTCDDNDIGVPGAGPQPKWPPNHVSEAFEAVAFKKSLILSPAEIYAEMAHHGAQACISGLKF